MGQEKSHDHEKRLYRDRAIDSGKAKQLAARSAGSHD
jgi:hypothetical protein